jgi:hypothetical protein
MKNSDWGRHGRRNMSQPHWRRLVVGGIVTCLTVMGSLIVSTGSANAYGSLDVRSLSVKVELDTP